MQLVSPVTHYSNPMLSTTISMETKNNLLNTIATMLTNLQQILVSYNKSFPIPIESIAKTINTYSSSQLAQSASSQYLWQPMLNAIGHIMITKEKMWKDMMNQKFIADTQLAKIQQSIMQLQQQKIVFIDTSQQSLQPVNNIPNINTNITLYTQQSSNTNNSQQHLNIINNSQHNIQLMPPSIMNIISNNNNNNNSLSNVPVNNKSDQIQPSQLQHQKHSITQQLPQLNQSEHPIKRKRKRKRRGYNGPYSEEEQTFMKQFKHNQTVQDILNMSSEMEKNFKVKRSPYGLAQKMYQLGIINSRLKAIFQRQFQNESKESFNSNESNINDKSPSINGSNNSNNVQLTSTNVSNNLNNDNVNNLIESKRKPFTVNELNYIEELMKNYNNEQPRKLYWRFFQKFNEWKNDTKSYQKFYHKYWTLANEQKDKLLNNHSKILPSSESERGNIDVQRKRKIEPTELNTNINPPSKKLRFS